MSQEQPGNAPADKLQPAYQGTIPEGDQLNRDSIREQIQAMFAALVQDDPDILDEAFEIRPIYEPTSKTSPAAKGSEEERLAKYKYRTFFSPKTISPENVEVFLDRIISGSNDQTNIFIGVNPRVKREDGWHGCTQDVKKVWFLHADVDSTGPEEVFQTLKAKDIYPTLIIRSSKNSGCHVWLRLKTPLDTSTKEGAYLAESLNKRLALLFGKKQDGKGGDSTHDIARVLRLPGLWNWPNKAKREKGREKDKSWLWRAYKTQHEWTMLERHLPELPPKAQVDVSSIDLSLDEAGRLAKALPYWNAICKKAGSFVGMSTNGVGNRSCEYVRILAWDFGLPVKKAIAMIRERNGEVLDDENYWEQYIQRECEGPFGNKLGTLKTEEKPMPIKEKFILPEIIKATDLLADEKIVLYDDLWEGVIRLRSKLFFGGQSKAKKTWNLMALACAVSNGLPYWGRKTLQGKVLYCNFELHSGEFKDRLSKIMDAMGINAVPNLEVLNLRGKACPIEEIGPALIERTRSNDYKFIILDPLYKVYGNRNENDAGDMASLCNEIEKVSEETGATLGIALHYAKGNASAKDPMDRISGSGVLYRDPDCMINLTAHKEEDAFTVSYGQRSHKPIPEICVRWQYPVFGVDSTLNPKDLKRPEASEKKIDKQTAVEYCTNPMGQAELVKLLMEEREVAYGTAFNSVKEAKADDLLAYNKGVLQRTTKGIKSLEKWAESEESDMETSFFNSKSMKSI